MLYQQGDVLLTSLSQLPKGKLTRRADTILAHGEATGHKHMAIGDAEVYERNGILYLRTAAGSTIVHEEHAAIDVPPGVYQISIVREYDHFAEEARNIRD